MYINIANSRENLRNLKCQEVYNMIGDVVIKILLSIGIFNEHEFLYSGVEVNTHLDMKTKFTCKIRNNTQIEDKVYLDSSINMLLKDTISQRSMLLYVLYMLN